MTFEAFDKWMLEATSGMSVLSYTTVTERLKVSERVDSAPRYGRVGKSTVP